MSDEQDDTLEQELRQLAARTDPVPPRLLQAAIDAFSWRDIDAELAELTFDSLLDQDQGTLVRGTAERRIVSFRTSALTIDIEVSSTGTGRSVMGQIVPAQPARVDIRHRAGEVTTDADDLGRFRSEGLQAGPMSLRLHPRASGAGPAVVTDWVSI
jgi:hypothetical protein